MIQLSDQAHYRAALLDRLRPLCTNLEFAKHLWAFQFSALFMWSADLDPIRRILAACYTGRGRPPRDPLAMFRTWLLATRLGITSARDWADRLRPDALLAILSGFDPQDTPGASTLRDFRDRLTRHMRRRDRSHRPHRKRPKGPAKGQKRPLRCPDVLWRLQAELPRFSRGDEGPLQEILITVAQASEELGLIDLEHLRIAGDSTLLPAHADTFGRRICTCSPATLCTCHRRFSDPDATWGWDSSRALWIYGHRFYEVTAAGYRHDLPLYILIVPHKSDGSRRSGREHVIGWVTAAIW